MVINKEIASDKMFNKAITYAEDMEFYIRYFNSLAYFNKPLFIKKQTFLIKLPDYPFQLVNFLISIICRKNMV